MVWYIAVQVPCLPHVGGHFSSEFSCGEGGLEVPGMSPREECGKMSKNEKAMAKNGKKVDRRFRSQCSLRLSRHF